MLLGSSVYKPGMLLNTLHCTGQPPAKNDLVQNTSGAKAEKPCPGTFHQYRSYSHLTITRAQSLKLGSRYRCNAIIGWLFSFTLLTKF